MSRVTMMIGARFSFLSFVALGSTRPRCAEMSSPDAEKTISRKQTRMVIMSTNGTTLRLTSTGRFEPCLAP